MLVFRITDTRYSSDMFGTGASMFGGRWNKKGTNVLYTGESREIALLETLVHLPIMLAPNLAVLTIEIPNNSITEFKKEDLPNNWMNYPAPTILSELAERWVKEEKTIALKVPSCIIHSASLYILNCKHPDYKNVKLIELKNFHFDSRLNK